MSPRVLLADDEPLVRERLRDLLATRAGWTLVGECADGIEAVETIVATRPDVALLDVRMPGLDGFEVLEGLPAAIRPAVVFVTAYDAYAVRAFEERAIDYLLKPIQAERFAVALDRVEERLARNEPARLPEGLPRARYAERFVVWEDHRLVFIPAAEVDWIGASGNYVKIHAKQRVRLVRETMKAVEARLDPEQFVRVHRSAIVRFESIVAMEPHFHGEFVLTLRDGSRLTASRTHAPRLRAMVR